MVSKIVERHVFASADIDHVSVGADPIGIAGPLRDPTRLTRAGNASLRLSSPSNLPFSRAVADNGLPRSSSPVRFTTLIRSETCAGHGVTPRLDVYSGSRAGRISLTCFSLLTTARDSVPLRIRRVIPLLVARNLWAGPALLKPSRSSFFPPPSAASSRPLRSRKPVPSGPSLRFGPAGSRVRPRP
jgi:hypothetical protein